MIKDADEACVIVSEDEKFSDNDFIDEFVLNDLINNNENNEKNVESISDEESSKKNNK